ncbi:1,2-phenylacetyl-CoA epoxidase subunit PaaC [Marinobacter lutaoensis]|jgi:ring-1,2-phenylacetyl-CoA epoxidase subunit PaaC|uniref:Phenylacetate-CoA oxygenase subunit PaaI n=1 Tax=Marinobacter lutaoensis TaxID=135739 RepID=A0A1V2DPZ4_9GAMM|nr:1,2-phenylacetyl-CoA epoxidase subunit PaaC [Marinobacter lutaoensis]MBE01515.1 phenylacetate-CoA oxygenase subunit PaaI [Marinobacter sp.]MBI43695.1 phenylacetate-CoA oxygenase subunit PaaI [Oceanospirillales bacterium]NVD35269.1 phenylacetate-CoA oxygenase subunit PaaC [Marinobacter lutaoensis]ONF42702.1 phenylacetate-CoA oxygenase subunit PaaI [Marinobacter lutaoensis]|tara:strand:+ start:3316 stop:4080 length:765 start_codon:yes stop_codon:yes gene_type:complete
MTDTQLLQSYLLRLADSDMILGQRLCELCGKAPALEEEMALMNVALDLVGQARNWYEYVAELEDQGRDADMLAFRRDAHEYRNLLLTEQPNGDYAVTMARQFFFDVWHYHTLQSLVNAPDERIAGIAAKALKEVTYHLRRSSEWIKRLGDGTEESHRRMQDAVDLLWRFTGELIQPDEVDQQIAKAGIGPDPEQLRDDWRGMVKAVLQEATLTPQPDDAWMYLGGKRGEHTEHLGFILAEMQFLQRAYPDAKVW